MFGVMFYLVVISVVRAVRAVMSLRRETKGRGLCAGCSFVHLQHAVNGRNAVFCTFGGGVRPVQIDVMYCTDYRDRNAPPRMVSVGFVREVAAAENTA